MAARFNLLTVSIASHSRDSIRPSFAESFALKNRGRREDRVRAAPAVSCARNAQANAHEHTGSAEAVRPSLRNGFTAYFVLSPARPGFLSPSLPRSLLLKNLTPTTGASGSHDFAVRTTIARLAILLRPPLPAPTSVTMANAPLSGRDSFNKQVIWV